MELNVRNLLNSHFIKSAIKEASYEQLQTIREKVNFVVDNLLEETKVRDSEALARQNKIAEFRNKLNDEGLTIEDLIGEPVRINKGRKFPPKYRFQDENGEERTWTGQGAKPRALQKLLDEGRNLEEFLIRN